MLLESLEVHHWRNLSGKLTWGSGLNILYGNNGQGKTTKVLSSITPSELSASRLLTCIQLPALSGTPQGRLVTMTRRDDKIG